ncbi:hypothetical protein [Pontibacter chitinilyticus]|uniref:hypothetical protein n=1 Tax=Pontibacter chitinilyticus TaxID=2674989 RepID=UPI0032197B46
MDILKKYTWLLALILLISCKKEEAAPQLIPGLSGTWTLKMVLANDHWGAPLTWREVQRSDQVRFTADGQYYEMQAGQSSFALVGTYEILDEDELKITETQPEFPEYPSHTVYYSLEPGNYLVITKKQFEGEVAQKYQLAE